MMAPNDPFLLGTNYWPRRKAMFWWEEFDAGEVREEFAMIRAIGLSHVRIFLLWESFQPKPNVISSEALSNLRAVCDVAADLGLKIQPTFFTGHMSGPNWAPQWLMSDRRRTKGDRQIVTLRCLSGVDRAIHNIYTDPAVIQAEDFQLRSICGELKDHPAIWSWSLGNEPDLFCRPPSAACGARWVADRAATIRCVDPNHPILIGLHCASLDGDVGFRVDQVAKATDISVMHGYSIYHPLARFPLDPDFVPFTCCLTAALAQRPVLYEEFGVNTCWPDQPSHWKTVKTWDGDKRRIYFASEEDAAMYYAAVLPKLQMVGALGAFSWCFGDYDAALWQKPPCDFQPHERFFGLFRADGSLKPMGHVVAKFAAETPKVQLSQKQVRLPIDVETFYADPEPHNRLMYQAFTRTVKTTDAKKA
jgi:endo-1,4-beta-mannosidase